MGSDAMKVIDLFGNAFHSVSYLSAVAAAFASADLDSFRDYTPAPLPPDEAYESLVQDLAAIMTESDLAPQTQG